MKMKSFFSKVGMMCVMSAAIMFMASCQSKEEKFISQLEDICEMVEDEDFAIEDYEKVSQNYEKILSGASDCDFTTEQLKEIGKLQGRITVALTKQSMKGAGNFFKGMMEGAKGMVEGITEGLEE